MTQTPNFQEPPFVETLRNSLNDPEYGEVIYHFRRLNEQEVALSDPAQQISTMLTADFRLTRKDFGDWSELTPYQAKEFMVGTIPRILIHSSAKISKEDCSQFADWILALFEQPRCFVNGKILAGGDRIKSVKFGPFDDGILFIDDRIVGIFWIADA